MVEFNPDGSIVLPASIIKQRQEKEFRLKKGKCILIKKEIVSFKSPKKCCLHLTLSEAITDNKFVHTIYKYFSENSEVPAKIIIINEKEFDIEVGTHFRRCSNCNALIKRFKDFLYGNLIEEKGSCPYEPYTQEFCYEDYFE